MMSDVGYQVVKSQDGQHRIGYFLDFFLEAEAKVIWLVTFRRLFFFSARWAFFAFIARCVAVLEAAFGGSMSISIQQRTSPVSQCYVRSRDEWQGEAMISYHLQWCQQSLQLGSEPHFRLVILVSMSFGEPMKTYLCAYFCCPVQDDRRWRAFPRARYRIASLRGAPGVLARRDQRHECEAAACFS
jgi:hypothetical protein